MKKLPDRRFHKTYLSGVLIPLFFSFLLFIVGILFYNYYFGIIALYIAMVCFLTSIGFIIWGRKRFINLQHEILEEELNTPVGQLNPISVRWIKINIYRVVSEGNTISLYDEGLKLNDNQLVPWDSLQVAEYIEGFIALSDEVYQDELWAGILIEATPLVINLLERFLSSEINKEKLEKQQLEFKEFIHSTVAWHFNWSLLIEKLLFIMIIILGGIAFGLYLIFRISFNQSVSISIVNLITIPILIFGYPKFFSDSNKKSFLVNKNGLGYAKGRYSIFISWKDIRQIRSDKRKITLYYHTFDQNNDLLKDTITIPKNKMLMKYLKDYKGE